MRVVWLHAAKLAAASALTTKERTGKAKKGEKVLEKTMRQLCRRRVAGFSLLCEASVKPTPWAQLKRLR